MRSLIGAVGYTAIIGFCFVAPPTPIWQFERLNPLVTQSTRSISCACQWLRGQFGKDEVSDDRLGSPFLVIKPLTADFPKVTRSKAKDTVTLA